MSNEFLPIDPEGFFFRGEDYSDPLGMNDYFLEEQKRKQRELLARTPIETGDWIDKATHFADELGKSDYLRNPLKAFALPKEGVDWLASKASGLPETRPVEEIFTSAFNPKPLAGDRSTLSIPYANEIQQSAPGEDVNKTGRDVFEKVGQFGLDPSTYTGLGLKGLPGALLGTAFGTQALQGAGQEFEQGEYTKAAIDAMMGVMGLKHGGSEFAHPIPEFKLGNSGMTSRSNLTFNAPELTGRPQVPNFASAMLENNSGFGGPPESPLGDFSGLTDIIGETLKRPRPLFRTVAEHGTPEGGFLDQGRTLRPSSEGAYGAGLYLSQADSNAPGYAQMQLGNTPTTARVAKGDVSAEKPLFLDEPAPRDLRMKAMIELNKAKQAGSIDPDRAELLKSQFLRPETTAEDLMYGAEELYHTNIPKEARAGYTGDPYADFIKSAGYDLWATGDRTKPSREMVVTDPRRQFRVGEVYDPVKAGSDKPILSDPDLPEILERAKLESEGQSLKNPTVRINSVPENISGTPGDMIDPRNWLDVEDTPSGPKDINVPTVIQDLAQKLGYKEDPFSGSRSNVVESVGDNTPLGTFVKGQFRKYGPGWEQKQTPEEKAFQDKLEKGSGKFIKVDENTGMKADQTPDPLVEEAKKRLANFGKEEPKTEFQPVETNEKAPDVNVEDLASQLRNEVHTDKGQGKSPKPLRNAKNPNVPDISKIQMGNEKKEPLKTFKVTLDDGRQFERKGTSEEDVKAQVEAALEEYGSDKKVVTTREVQSKIQEAASTTSASEKDLATTTKELEKQGKQDIKERLQADKEQENITTREASREDKQRTAAHIKELRDQLKVEQQKGDQANKQRISELKDQIKLQSDIAKAQNQEDIDNARKKQKNEDSSLRDRIKLVDKLEREQAAEIAKGTKSADTAKTSWSQSPIIKVLNAAKSIAYGGDVGHLLRQGKQLNASLLFSKKAGDVLKQFPVIFKSAKNEKFFNDFHEKLNADPDIRVLTDRFGLDMPGVGKGHLKEEIFHEAGLAEKLPLVGKYYAKPSERAYTAGLNFLRAAEAKRLVENLKSSGFTPEKNPEKYQAIARAINIISQRGNFSPGFTQGLAESSAIFGAPRAKAARVQNLVSLFRAGESNDILRKSFAKTMGFNIAMFGLLKAANPDMKFVTDPDSTDFLKFRIRKNFALDPWMGLGTTARTVSKVITGKSVSPYTGRSYSVTPDKAVGTEVLNMLSPGIRMVYQLLSGQTPTGFLIDRKKALLEGLPMSPRQSVDNLKEGNYEGAILQLMGEDVNEFDYDKSHAEQTRLKEERGLSTPKKSKRKYSF